MNEVLLNIISVIVTTVIVPLVTWSGAELIKLIQAKTKTVKDSEYLSVATNVVTNAVKTVFQTYVESLKKSGTFTKEAQAEALKQAKETVLCQLSEDVKAYITANFGDFNTWLTTQIESTINTLKNL